MSNNFFKSVGKNAKQAAKEMAKKVAHEPVEVFKDVKNQIISRPEIHNNEPSMMQQVMTGDGSIKEVSSQEEQSIHSQAKNRLAQIEAELRNLRMQREQRSGEWMKEQEELMGHREGVSQEAAPQPVEMPTGPKKGPRAQRGSHKKGGTMEVGRQKKG